MIKLTLCFIAYLVIGALVGSVYFDAKQRCDKYDARVYSRTILAIVIWPIGLAVLAKQGTSCGVTINTYA